ncbi:MAG TPA: HD domain-containing phosphohydrolase [Terriglobales bacterium]|nr:HD domain-containing phosphohydrolase [Terriglobales bacterium]
MAEVQQRVRLFVFVVCALGALCIGIGAYPWHTTDLVQFACYLLLTAVASGMKVILPGFEATVSVNFIFFLLALCNLSLPEALALGAAAALVQCYWKATKRLRFVHFSFNLSQITLAIFAAYWTYRLVMAVSHGHGLIALLVSSIAYFLFNTWPVATVVALSERKSPFEKWTETYAWTFPYYLIGAAVAGVFQLLNRVAGWELSVLLMPAMYAIYYSYRLYIGKLEEKSQYLEEMARIHLRTIEALALAIEAKDHTTGAHLERVRVYALELGKDLGISEDEMAALKAAAVLHDIGKLAVPEHIISKPGKLTPEEFEKMKVHPVVGAEILEQVHFPYPVAPIVRSHHEKWDGTGYPDGLAGEAIPIGSRILAAVDCLDALASDRQYRKALPLDEAMARVEADAGKHFDPRVVAALKSRYKELEALAHSQQPEEKTKLSVDAKITRGEAPAAGFAEPAASSRTEAGDVAVTRALHKVGVSENNVGFGEAISTAAMRLRNAIAFDSIVLFASQGNDLVPCFVLGENARALARLRILRGRGLIGWVAENRNSIVNGNPLVEPGYLNAPAELNSALAVPVEHGGTLLGVLSLYHGSAGAFTSADLKILAAYATAIGLLMSSKEGEYISTFDVGLVCGDYTTSFPEVSVPF